MSVSGASDAVLLAGAMPLTVLASAVDNYIA
ncbi:MAG: hypothetical protein JWM82_1811, partial [Myxococcales bacterium]|nr:hypothetical protein [Myxococcales bacterium]